MINGNNSIIIERVTRKGTIMINFSDQEWALRMKDKGFSYNIINNHKRSLKAIYIAIQDDCVRKTPQFKLNHRKMIPKRK